MNWKLIFLLLLFGLLMGIGSVTGVIGKFEWLCWLIIAVISALSLSKTLAAKHFVHGLLIGLFDAVINGIVQSAFFSAYLSNNAGSIEGLAESSVNPRVFLLLMGPIVGLIYGCVIGFFAVTSFKLGFKQRKTDG